eukprot:scaffold55173_cov64-Attheya_sp.AAC.2
MAWDTGAAMALYCAAHPSLFRECKKALELSCGSEFAGIMSTAAVGAAFPIEAMPSFTSQYSVRQRRQPRRLGRGPDR